MQPCGMGASTAWSSAESSSEHGGVGSFGGYPDARRAGLVILQSGVEHEGGGSGLGCGRPITPQGKCEDFGVVR